MKIAPAPLSPRSALLLSLSLAAGCAGAPRAQPAAPPRVVAAQADGVSLSVPAVAPPPRLAALPGARAVYVVLENHGRQEIAVSKDDFVLDGAGARRAALSPEDVARAAARPAAPLHRRIVRARRFGATLSMPPLPRREDPAQVLSASLPDGTLGPGGRVAGYLYFAEEGAPRSLALGWRVRDEASQQPIGDLKVPIGAGRQ